MRNRTPFASIGFALSAVLLLESMAYLLAFGPIELKPPHNKAFDVVLLITNFQLWKLALGASLSLSLHSTTAGSSALWRRAHLVLTAVSLGVFGTGFLFCAVVIFVLRVWGLPPSWQALSSAFGPMVYLAYSILCYTALWLTGLCLRPKYQTSQRAGPSGSSIKAESGSQSRLPVVLLLLVAACSSVMLVGCSSNKPAPMVPGEIWVDFNVNAVDLGSRTLFISQLFNEPDDIPVSTRISVRKDAVIVFYKAFLTSEGEELRQTERRGQLSQLAPGQHGGLILDKQKQARFIGIHEGFVVVPGDKR